MILKKFAILFGSFSLVGVSYFIYLKRCYKYLKSLGYDHPPPKFFIGNLLEFVSKENSVSNDPHKPSISHYSKTLKRYTAQYGKIYGFYEGHSPVLVLADPDLVTGLFVNQNKLISFRRSFPMSKSSSDPTADVFVSNGIRWLRIRYGLEKVMLNVKNIARCVEYTDESFLGAFIKQPDLNKPQQDFNIHMRAKLFIIYSMFNIIFGTDLQTFIIEKPFSNDQASKLLGINETPNLKQAQLVATKFSDAFQDYESFSLLKLFAMTIPELGIVWRNVEKFKKFFNSNICSLSYFADPMDWFYAKFINKHLALYALKSNENSVQDNSENNSVVFSTSSNVNQDLDLESKLTNSGMSIRKFGYLNSFLSLTTKPIFKYPKINLNNRIKVNPNNNNFRDRNFYSTTSDRFASKSPKIRSFSERDPERNLLKKPRTFSNDFRNLDITNKRHRMSYLSTSVLTKETESNEFENWKLTIEEALSNSLLMLFAGYETTSSAIGFCCHVLTELPEERDKLLEEIKENWKSLSYNLEKYKIEKNAQTTHRNDDYIISDTESSINDDVFETDDAFSQKNKSSLDEWSDLSDALEKLKYLDMFIREVLRMFPIANSMVSRKCVVEGFYLDNGKYYIPKDMNVVVDVLSIHYDKVLWGPVDPEIFHPERFLTERNPAAWLAFGIGARKCLGMKLAMSQIKLFIVRLLQNYELSNSSKSKPKNKSKFSETIETKDVLFNGPIESINVSISRRENYYSD